MSQGRPRALDGKRRTLLRRVRMLAIGALIASFLGSTPAWASDPAPQDAELFATICNGGSPARSCSSNYGGSSGWGGVTNRDNRCDGYGSYAPYYRNTGGAQRLTNGSGCNTTVETGTSSNLVARFRACTDVNAFPDWCSDWVWR
jgi:hypothetical protein